MGGMQAHRRRAADTERMVDAAAAEVKADWDAKWQRMRAEKRAADAERSKSARENALDRREAAGLPVIPCPCCGARVDHRSGHWMPEHIDQYGLVVPGYYTCADGDAA